MKKTIFNYILIFLIAYIFGMFAQAGLDSVYPSPQIMVKKFHSDN